MNEAKHVRVLRQKCSKEGQEQYFNFFLVWEHDNKVFNMKIRPSFYSEVKLLIAMSQEIEQGEPVAKYL